MNTPIQNNLFSFVVISYNRPHDTCVVTQNILDLDEVYGYEKEIIIINNGSPESYAEWDNYLSQLTKEDRSKIHYVDHEENLGVARGRNLGIQMAKGDILIFIDDDAEFQQKNVLSVVLEKFKTYEQNGNVKLLAFREWRTATNEYYIASKDKIQAQEPEFFTNFFVGSGHAVKREVFDTVGLYTTEFFYGMEEYDLAYKTLEEGYRILYTSDVTVSHHKSPSGRAAEKTLARWNLENKTVVAYKYLPYIYVFSHLLLWTAYFLYNFKFDLKTLWQAYKNLPGKISRTERNPISKHTLAHIKRVKGRLWF